MESTKIPRLMKEREREIRDQAWAKSAYVVELLAEIDALRTENATLKAALDGLVKLKNPLSLRTPS